MPEIPSQRAFIVQLAYLSNPAMNPHTVQKMGTCHTNEIVEKKLREEVAAF